eukprot:ctg_751.g298
MDMDNFCGACPGKHSRKRVMHGHNLRTDDATLGRAVHRARIGVSGCADVGAHDGVAADAIRAEREPGGAAGAAARPASRGLRRRAVVRAGGGRSARLARRHDPGVERVRGGGAGATGAGGIVCRRCGTAASAPRAARGYGRVAAVAAAVTRRVWHATRARAGCASVAVAGAAKAWC